MVEWLAGNRIRGTSAEKPVLGLQSPSVGGWVELGRATAGSSDSSLNVSSLPDKEYYMFLTSDYGHSTAQARLLRYNSDAGGNYNRRYRTYYGSTSAENNSTGHTADNGFNANNTYPQFNVHYMSNKLNKEKLHMSQGVARGSTGAGSSPERTSWSGKWTGTSVVDKIDYIQNAGTHVAGSELVVLGWDEDDTHTTNFWEELASAELSSASMRIDSGTFTAKKYLWIQIYNTAKPSGGNSYVYYNNVVTGTTHSGRSNTNGMNPTNQSSNSDYQLTSSNGSIINHDVSSSGTTTGMFTNMFVINNASNEKLSIIHSVSGWTNAGSGVAPARFLCAGKWANTTDQITSVQCGSTSNSTYMGAGSIIKVWGSN